MSETFQPYEPEKPKIYCSPALAAQLERLMEQGINPLEEIGPWPVFCPACGGEGMCGIPFEKIGPRGQIPGNVAPKFKGALICIGSFDGDKTFRFKCAACDGRGTVEV